MKNTKIRLDMLREGTKFTIDSLEDWMFRDLVLISTSDCSSLIEGFKRDSKEEQWKPFRYHVSNSVLVSPVTSDFYVDTTRQRKTNKEIVVETFQKKSRGRPRKTKVAFKDLKGNFESFTVKDIIVSNPELKSHEVNSLIKEGLNENTIELCGEKRGKIGKPQKVYKLI